MSDFDLLSAGLIAVSLGMCIRVLLEGLQQIGSLNTNIATFASASELAETKKREVDGKKAALVSELRDTEEALSNARAEMLKIQGGSSSA